MKNLLSFQLLEVINTENLSSIKGGGIYTDMLLAGQIGIRTNNGIVTGSSAVALVTEWWPTGSLKTTEWWPTGSLQVVGTDGNDLGDAISKEAATEWWPTGSL
ncbi:MAG: hypothetical protein RIQ33_1210 [Bacteroidota bacterium]|jgi:hypothetical protein